MAGSDVTHSVYRSTAYVTRICADATNAAAVAVSLNNAEKSSEKYNRNTTRKGKYHPAAAKTGSMASYLV